LENGAEGKKKCVEMLFIHPQPLFTLTPALSLKGEGEDVWPLGAFNSPPI